LLFLTPGTGIQDGQKFQFLVLGSAIYKKDQISKSLGLKMNKFFVADPEPFDSKSGMEKF
jgi:hypothetical protein